jgi:hypothetical protein
VLRDEKPLRLCAALVGALAVHGVVVAVTYSFGRLDPRPDQPPAPIARMTEVALDDGHLDTARSDLVERQVERETPLGGSAESAFAPRRPTEESNPISTPDKESPTTTAQEGYALDPTAPNEKARDRPPVNLGIGPGSWSLWVDPTAPVAHPSSSPPFPPTVERTPAPASSTGGLAEALEAHDHERGLGPAGRVLSAAYEAGHSDIAPAIGTAAFTITVLRTGGIQVDLVGASSNAAAWGKVADNMAAAIKKKPPRIDGGRNGVRIAIELVAEERWPSGAPARSEGPSLALSGGSLKPTNKAIEDLRRRNPAAVPPPGGLSDQPPLQLNVDPPGLWLKGRGKVCAYQVGISPLGPGLSGGCDPSNIGAPPSRVVSTRVTDQTML